MLRTGSIQKGSTKGAKPVPFERVSLGPYGDEAMFESPRFFVLLSEAEYRDVYGFRRAHEDPQEPKHGPKVDFEKHILITVHRGLCPTGGYTVKIVDITAFRNEVRVYVRRRDPKPDEIVTLVMTYPYDAVLVPRAFIPPSKHTLFVLRWGREKKLTITAPAT